MSDQPNETVETPGTGAGEPDISDQKPDTSTGQPDETVDTPDETVDNPAAQAKGREASKLRERLRVATERLAVLQRGEAERLAAGKLGAGADLWAGGIDLTSLLNEEGDIDPDLVAQAADRVIEAHPHWKKRAPASPPASSVTADGKITGDTRPTFADAFGPRDRRSR